MIQSERRSTLSLLFLLPDSQIPLPTYSSPILLRMVFFLTIYPISMILLWFTSSSWNGTARKSFPFSSSQMIPEQSVYPFRPIIRFSIVALSLARIIFADNLGIIIGRQDLLREIERTVIPLFKGKAGVISELPQRDRHFSCKRMPFPEIHISLALDQMAELQSR